MLLFINTIYICSSFLLLWFYIIRLYLFIFSFCIFFIDVKESERTKTSEMSSNQNRNKRRNNDKNNNNKNNNNSNNNNNNKSGRQKYDHSDSVDHHSRKDLPSEDKRNTLASQLEDPNMRQFEQHKMHETVTDDLATDKKYRTMLERMRLSARPHDAQHSYNFALTKFLTNWKFVPND